MEQSVKVIVNESFNYDLETKDLNELDLINLGKLNYHVLKNNHSYKVKLYKSDFNNSEYILEVNSTKYHVKILNALDQTINKIGLSKGFTKKSNAIKAPMPGLILSINVKEKQAVKEGAKLLILEAMKMENTIEAPKNGVVKSINIKVGDIVSKEQLLIDLE